MLGNDRMETVSTAATSRRCRNDIEKSTWRTHHYFVDFEGRIQVEISTSRRIQVEISTSNQRHNFHVDSPFKIKEISMNFQCGISTSNRWWIDEDVSIGYIAVIGMQYRAFKSYFYAFSVCLLFSSFP